MRKPSKSIISIFTNRLDKLLSTLLHFIRKMFSKTSAIVALAFALTGYVSAYRPTIQLYTVTNCAGDPSSQAEYNVGACYGVKNTKSIEQNASDDGIKFTCMTYSDDDCKDQTGLFSFTDCVSQDGSTPIGSFRCNEDTVPV